MDYKDYRRRCRKCGYIGVIPADWFNNTMKTRKYECESCNQLVILNVEKIRHKFYNDFHQKTQIVGMGNSDPNQYFLKVTSVESKGFFEVNDNVEQILIGRGSNLGFVITENEKIYRLILPDKFVSREHASIEIQTINDKKTLIFKDNKSLNGSIYNSNKLEEGDEIIIQPDDSIILGETSIVICV